MNWDYYDTNEDCKSCCCSHVVDISSEYEEHVWKCTKGHSINLQNDTNRKQCGLKSGEYYSSQVVKRK